MSLDLLLQKLEKQELDDKRKACRRWEYDYKALSKENAFLHQELKELRQLNDELIDMVERGAVIVDALVVKQYLEKYPNIIKH